MPLITIGQKIEFGGGALDVGDDPSDNQLMGELPRTIGQPPDLRELDLKNTYIPKMLASMIKLTFLALKTPTIPSHLSFHQLNALLH